MTNDLISFKELSALQRTWVMLLAHSLEDREPLSWKEAVKKAWLTMRLLHALGRGVVRFAYRKEDGSLRKAVGTLCRGVCEGFDDYKGRNGKNPRDNSNTDGTYVYWDLERNSFRAFRSVSLVYME